MVRTLTPSSPAYVMVQVCHSNYAEERWDNWKPATGEEELAGWSGTATLLLKDKDYPA
ncbi:unnamed protein product, partial [Lepidochelys olivacea]